MDDLLARLACTPVFRKLSSGDRSDVARRALRREYAREEFIFRQEDVWPFALMLAAGRLQWSIISFDGRRQALFEIREGEVIWGTSFFDDQPMPADAQVMVPSIAYRWDRDTLLPVLLRSPEALWEVSCVLARSMRRVREIVYGFAFHTVAGRLAKLLVNRYPQAEGKSIRRDLTLDELASLVGATPAMVCKTLYGFADKGFIRLTRTEFEFVHRASLERLALQGQA